MSNAQFRKTWLMAAIALTLSAQGQETLKARLSPVPIDAQLAPKVTGVGSVTAVLAGAKLTLTGSFEGLRSPATSASLLQSKMTGVRSTTAVHDLTVAKAPSGSISGAIDLTPAQVEAFRKGLLYVVVNSEGAPEGNLWGWLFK